MQQCSIYDNRSLNFFRAACGLLTLVAFLIHNTWLVLITGILFLLGMFSMKLNLLYQFGRLVFNKVLKQKTESVVKDPGELKFVYGFTALMFFISFALIYFEKFSAFGWGLNLLVSFLTLLASFANICLASLMYIIFKKALNK